MLIVHQGTAAQGEAFLRARWPAARAVVDPAKRLYTAFGLTRGSFTQLFGLRAIGAAVRSIRHGIGMSIPQGDPFVLAGAFVVDGGEIIAADRAVHAGAKPDFERLFDACRQAAAGAQD